MGGRGGGRREMTAEEAESFIVALLGDGRRLSTEEIDAASAEAGRRCPDATVRFLAKLRLRGIIEGELSMVRRGWVWWLPERGAA